MKKLVVAALATLALVGGGEIGYAQHGDVPRGANGRVSGNHGGTVPGHGFHGGRHHRVVAIFVPGAFFWMPGYYYPYYPASYYPASPMYIEQDPPVNLQQQPDAYWYYCPDATAYYPYVQNCANGWLVVVPDSPPLQ